MIYQLRTYTVNRGMMDDWVAMFNNELVGVESSGHGAPLGVPQAESGRQMAAIRIAGVVC